MNTALRTVATCLILATASASVAATPRLLTRKAFVAAPARPQGCLAGAGLTHAAYLPAASTPSLGCGHLLSTDTMMTVHRWDRT